MVTITAVLPADNDLSYADAATYCHILPMSVELTWCFRAAALERRDVPLPVAAALDGGATKFGSCTACCRTAAAWPHIVGAGSRPLAKPVQQACWRSALTHCEERHGSRKVVAGFQSTCCAKQPASWKCCALKSTALTALALLAPLRVVQV